MTAAPTPCTARIAISQEPVPAKPDASDARPKIRIPMVNRAFSPTMSPSRPAAAARQVNTSK